MANHGTFCLNRNPETSKTSNLSVINHYLIQSGNNQLEIIKVDKQQLETIGLNVSFSMIDSVLSELTPLSR